MSASGNEHALMPIDFMIELFSVEFDYFQMEGRTVYKNHKGFKNCHSTSLPNRTFKHQIQTLQKAFNDLI